MKLPYQISLHLLSLCLLLLLLTVDHTEEIRGKTNTAHVTDRPMDEKRTPNRLIREKSPYLLQHAYNPVDWYSWGDEAFARARTEQKPIFLSIGYSTCHWCHVMERESFEDDSIASLMNLYFVNIKVDREERPDVDKVYMTALQSMGQNGGWPMSMFLTPDLKPFFGGTYFPPQTMHGRIGFPDLLQRIHDLWENERPRILESAAGLLKALQHVPTSLPSAGDLDAAVLDTCFQQFARTFDTVHGGFGGAPKFPRPAVFQFLLRYHASTGDRKALEMVELSLRRMVEGGIYDHLGGGFHRYSVDAQWRVPHFEKMLYDQAQLVQVYADLYRITRDEQYATVVREALDYVLRDLHSPDGGFFSAEDADSPHPGPSREKGEGVFYIWSRKEIIDLLGPVEGEVFSLAYGVQNAGNALTDPHREFTGKNILYRAHDDAETSRLAGLGQDRIREILSWSRQQLFAAREKRPRPHRDDKVLTSWNGLMISAFCQGYQVLGDERYLAAARQAGEFLFARLFDSGTRKLHRRYRDGEVRHEAHLDDHAYLVQGLLDFYESSGEFIWLERALDLTRVQIETFRDEKGGGFFDTSGEDPSILVRMKDVYDGAEPSGNSVAASNLLRLEQMTDNRELGALARRTIEAFGGILRKQPVVMPAMAAALCLSLSTPMQVIIAGKTGARDTKAIAHEVFRRYLPNKVMLYADGEAQQKKLSSFVPAIKDMSALEGKATAYVCENYVCQLPTSDPAVVASLLTKKQE